MSPHLQTLLALALVALAAGGLVWRALAQRRNPGCGGGCGCPSGEIRTRLKAGAREAQVPRRLP